MEFVVVAHTCQPVIGCTSVASDCDDVQMLVVECAVVEMVGTFVPYDVAMTVTSCACIGIVQQLVTTGNNSNSKRFHVALNACH